MSKKTRRTPRVPRTRKATMYVLPEVPDAADAELKNALAIRNACAVEGRCPDCGVVGVFTADATYDGIYHITFQHGTRCRALTDDQVGEGSPA